jgi:hypothetical protein
MVVMRRQDAHLGNEEYAVYDPRSSDRFQADNLDTCLRFFLGTLDTHANEVGMRNNEFELELGIPGTPFVGMIDYGLSDSSRPDGLRPCTACNEQMVKTLHEAIISHVPSRMCVVRSKKRLREEPSGGSSDLIGSTSSTAHCTLIKSEATLSD